MSEKKLIFYSILLLIFVGLASAFFFSRATRLEFNYNFESYFPTGDKDPEFFYDFRKKFGSDNDYVFIALENKKGIFRKDFLKKVKDLSDSLALLEFVESVQSPVSLRSAVISEMGFFEIPFLHIDFPDRYQDDSVRIFGTEWLINSFFSADGTALNLVVKNKAMLAKKKCDALLLSIEGLLKRGNFDDYSIAGRIHAQHHYLIKMKKEFILFFIASLVLVILLLLITYQSGWGVAFPVIAVLVSIVWLFGLINLTGKSLDLLSSLLPTIIFVVGMSDAVHIISKYLEELRNGCKKITALKIAIKEIGMATFLTSFTTATGFLSLLTSSIQPIRQFGLYSAMGVCIAFIAVYLVLPPLLLLMKEPRTKKFPKKDWNKIMHSAFLKVIRNRKIILAISLLLFLVSFLGMRNLKVNNFLLEDLSEDDEFKKEYLYFEKKFSGARPFEMGLWLKDSTGSFLNIATLSQLEKIENYLRKEYGAGFIVSPVTLVKTAHQALSGGSLNEYKIPSSEEKMNAVKKFLKKTQRSEEYKIVLAEDNKHARISGKIPDFGSYILKQKNEALENFFSKNINSSAIGYKITGTATLIDKNHELLAKNMLFGLMLAFLIIALAFGIIYFSFRIVIIALIPNILPLALTAGLMGFSGIDLKISTSIIFTIAFGIAVDDTIHFLSRMKLEMKKGRTWLYAMKRTYISTGKALVLTTFILTGGFLTLLMSDFASSFYMGLLISLSLFFALAADMVLLPALLMVFKKK